MADLRSALLSFLRLPDVNARASARGDLASRVDGASLESLRAALAKAPDDAEALASLLAKMIADGASEDALVDSAKVAAQRASREDAGNDVAKLVGEVVWRFTGQPKLAEPYFRRARRTDAAGADVLAFYRELFVAASDASQLMQVLVQARRGASDLDVRFALAQEMAALALERLGSADRAIEVWRASLREDNEARAVEPLRALYREGKKWTALVELAKEEFERVPDDEAHRADRVAKLLAIADLYRRELKLDAMALATLQRILDIDPKHDGSLEALAETYAASSRWNDLLAIYARMLANAVERGDTDARLASNRRIARVWVEKLGNPQRALEPLSEVLALAPRDAEARATLARIHEQRRDFRALIALRREELAEATGDDALALRIDLARLAEEKLGDRREAISDWNAVLEHHGDVDVALEALTRLYEREARWPELAEILHRRVAKTAMTAEGVKLLASLGQIYVDRLRSREDAIAVWREIVRLVPNHDKATRMLRDAYVSMGRWEDLERLYLDQNRVGVLVDVLQSAADRVAATEDRVALYRRVAALCRDVLVQPERAIKALERTLAIQPDNLAVARELVPIYRDQGNWARLMGTYEVLLGAATDDDERMGWIAALQEVARDHLHSPALTYQWCARAYDLRPQDAAVLASLETAAEHSDAWDDFTARLEARLAKETLEDVERLLLLDKLAAVARDRLLKPDDAQRYFRRIIEIDPKNGEAMSALEHIYTTTRRWDDLCAVYTKRLEVTTDRAARLQTLRGLARLQEAQLGELDGAVGSLRGVLDLEPDDVAALDALASIHRRRGEWEALAGILQRRLDLLPEGPAQVPVLFELSKIYATRLGDSPRAITGFSRVLELDPNHVGAVGALEDLRREDPQSSLPVMQALLPYYRRTEDRAKEAAALEVIVAAEGDGAKQRELRRQIAASYAKMPDKKREALTAWRELFVAEPSDWEARQTFHRLARELDAIADVATAYERVLEGFTTRASEADASGRTIDRAEALLRRDLLLELGALHRDALARPAEAERAFATVLEQDETHQAAYEALEKLLRARGAHRELVDLYRRRIDAVFNQREQRDLLSRIVEIARNVLGDRPLAIQTAEELLDIAPDDVSTLSILAQMYDQGDTTADRERLEELLGRWSELESDPRRRHELMCKRASLRVQHLGDAFGAVDLLGAVLAENEAHGKARALLEELLDIAEVQAQVVDLLEPLYTRLGEHRGRIRAMQVRRAMAERDGATDLAISHMLEVARIHERDLGDLEMAWVVVKDAWLSDVRRQDSLAELERVGSQRGDERQVVEVFRSALEKEEAAERTLRIDLVRRIAAILDERLRDAVGAREAFMQLLALDPSDAALAHRTVAALCRLHLEAGDFIDLVETRRALLRFVDSPREQVAIRLRIAREQLDHLFDRVGAALTWSEVLDMEPANEEALLGLEKLFTEESEWGRLVEVLHHRITVSQDPRVQSGLWRRIGDVQFDRLDPATAIPAYQSVQELKTSREEQVHALRRLIEIFSKLERWADVEDGLRRLTALAERDSERVELITSTADVVGRQLGRGVDALDLLKRVLDLSPTHARARALCREWLEHEDTRERALRILAPLYEAEGSWEGLLELQELQARKQPSGRKRLQALLKVATTQEERLGDPGRAFGVLCEALTEAADQPELVEILERVERLGATEDRAAGLYTAYDRTWERILDADLQLRVLRALGHVAADRLGRLDEARRAFERVLEHSPDDKVAFEALERIHTVRGAHAELAALLERRAAREGDAQRRDGLLIRAAELLHVELAQPEAAIGLYERLSADGMARQEVQNVLEPLYEVTGRYRALAGHLAKKVQRLRGTMAVETHMRLGRLYGEKLGDVDEGIRHLSIALRLDPSHTVGNEELDRYMEDENMRLKVADILEPVFTTTGDWGRLVQVQEIRLAAATDEETRVKTLRRIARIHEEQLEDLERAYDVYARVFAETPFDGEIRDQLARLAKLLGRLELYAGLLTEWAGGVGEGRSDDDAIDIVADAARLWARALKQPVRAVPLFERALAARSEDFALFSELESALEMSSDWPALLAAYWREIDGSLDESRQIALLGRAAVVAMDAIGSREEGARAYRRILELRPDHEQARAQLELALEQSEQWRDLVEHLRDGLARIEDGEARAEVMLRIAALLHGPLDDGPAAVEALEALLAEVPSHPPAIAALESIAEARAGERPRVFAILEPIYQQNDDVPRQIVVFEWRLSILDTAAERHEAYRSLASLVTRLDRGQERAFSVFARAVAEPGADDDLAQLDGELRGLAERLGGQAPLVDVLLAAVRGAALAEDVPRRVALLVWAGETLLSLGDAARAAEVLREAAELDDDDVAVLSALERAYTTLARHEDACNVLARLSALVEDDARRLELLRRLGRLLEDVLSVPAEAEQVWRRVLDLEPDDGEALQRLARSYEASGSVRELVDVLVRRIEAATTAQERRSLRWKLATLHREARGDRDAEVEVLRESLLDTPGDDEVLAALARGLIALERWMDAVEVLGERAERAGDPQLRAGHLWEAAKLLAAPLGDGLGAVDRLREALQAAPDHSGALELLVKLAADPTSSESATAVALPALEATGRHGELASVLQARVDLTDDPDERVRCLQNLASLRYAQLGDKSGALAATSRLLDVAPVEGLPEVVAAALRLAVELQEVPAQVAALAARAASEDRDPGARVVFALAAAEASLGALSDAPKALSILVAALDASIAERRVCLAIEELAGAAGERALAVRALSELAAQTVGEAEHGAILVRLAHAQLLVGAYGEATNAAADALDLDAADAGAIALLEQVCEAAGASTPEAALDALEQAYRARGDATGLTRVTRRRLTNAHPSERGAIFAALAQLCEDGGGTPAEALDAWIEALKLDPESPTALDHAVALAEVPGLAHAVAEQLDAVVAHGHDSGGRVVVAVALAAAQVWMQRVGEPARARLALEAVLAAEAEHEEALALLVDAARAAGDATLLHSTLVRVAKVNADPVAAARALREAAELARGPLANVDLAIADLEAIVQLTDDDGAAWTTLFELLTASGKSSRLADAYRRRIDAATSDDERRTLRHRLANLLVEPLGLLDEAEGVYEDMLAADGADFQAIVEFEVLLRRREKWSEVRDVLERKYEAVGAGERVAVLEELARLFEHRLASADDAIDTWRRIRMEAPAHAAAMTALERLFDRTERWRDLAELLEDALQAAREARDNARLRDVASRLATLLARRLDDTDRAQEILSDLLETDPNDVAAMLALADVYEARGDTGAMRLMLQRAASQSPEGSAGARLAVRLAKLTDEADARREHLIRAIELDPSFEEGGTLLLAQLESEGRWPDVASLLDHLAEFAPDAEHKRQMLLREADVLSQRVGDHDGALKVLAAIYAQVNDDAEVNARIADALFRAERWEEAAGMYNWLVDVTGKGKKSKQLGGYLTRLGRIALMMGQSEQALTHLEAAYKTDTTNVETLLALGGLHEQAGRWQDALRIYRTMLLQNADQSGALRRGDIYLRLAMVHVGLAERPKAQAMLRRGLEEDPQHPELAGKLAELGG
jgi:tetratricopeptide (TPR) repeat protein